MSEKKVPLFFKLKETLFSYVFYTFKNEQARTLASFSHVPHVKQEVEKANKTVQRARNNLEYSRRSY
jgi:hypothetical protein